ncbi:hypothetical protein OROHE_015620 [Orobanche hederae]
MTTEKSPNTTVPSSGAPNPSVTSCRKKNNEEATFLQDFKDHIDEFIHASMDEHKTCFQKTIKKMFGMSKVITERSSETNEVESSLPLQTTLAENKLHPKRGVFVEQIQPSRWVSAEQILPSLE